jgi:hypothetical protein
MPDNLIYINGINGSTGKYLYEPTTIDDLAAMIQGQPKKESFFDRIGGLLHKLITPSMGVESTDITQVGWGIVFLKDEDPAVKAALQPLIDHRAKQINNDKLCKVLDLAAGEEWEAWLGRYEVAPGNQTYTHIPYYLLLVGDPQKITLTFGHLLSVEYAVGWLNFDSPADYSAYVSSLIEYETANSVPNGKEAVFFGTRHPFDQATKMSADYLVNPLADGMPASGQDPAEDGVAVQFGYKTTKIWGNNATKAALMNVVCPPAPGTKPPALLFSASHGVGFDRGDPLQQSAQGSLVCQDWPGYGSIAPKHYFSAADVPPEASVHGMFMFHFACYGGGTPDRDQFVHNPGVPPQAIADKSFLAALPKAWLTHPKGGALAVIGHVERAWGFSIIPAAAGAGVQVRAFQNAIGQILAGLPVGLALSDFNKRYAALSTKLTGILQKSGWGQAVDSTDLTTTWIERNDAEGYILIGDPAAHVRAEDLA